MHDDSATLIRIAAVRQEQFASWLALRQAVYTGIDRAFHEQEMRSIFAARDKNLSHRHRRGRRRVRLR